MHGSTEIPWLTQSQRTAWYARLRRECRGDQPGIIANGDQSAVRSGNMISSWLRTISQFWQRACQYFMMRWEAGQSILRRESSLVKSGLFLVI